MKNFKEFEQSAWEIKADRYNDTWGTVTAQPIEEVLSLANVRAGTTLLDCGCGPGHLCQAAFERGARVLGCDYSQAMVKIAQVNYPKISFTQEDVENMSFHDRSFDVVILNYLLLHVPDPRKALLEAKRVLRQKGKLVFTMWLAPSFSPGLQMIFSAIKEYADTSVIPPAQDIFLFSDAEYSTKFLAENGFSNIKTSIFATFWQVSSGESFFSAIQAGTRMGGMIDLQQPNIKEKIKAKMVKDIEQFKADNEYLIPMPSIIVCGEL